MTLDLPLMEEPATVELTDVVRTYSGATGGVRALDGVSARFESGLFTVVAGPSGSGKSTLLRVAALLDKPQEGLVGFNGRDVTRASARRRRALRRRHIGYMFQQPADNLLDYLDAREHVRLGGRLRSDDEDAAARRLDKAQQHGEQRRLSATARTHDGDGLPWLDGETEVVERGDRSPRVLHSDAVKSDGGSAQVRRRTRGAGGRIASGRRRGRLAPCH